MVEPHTFVTALYVMVDDFFKAKCTPEKGPNASLTRSEVVRDCHEIISSIEHPRRLRPVEPLWE